MKTLKEHEEERVRYYETKYKNGIECPMCHAELIDSNPHIQLLTSPPKLDIQCLECGYRGYRTL